MPIVFLFLFIATVGGHQADAQELRERVEQNDKIDGVDVPPARGLRAWIKRRWEAQQNAVKAEEKRRAKSRSCLYISSGVCRRQIPTAPSHWRSVQKRRYNRKRSRSLAKCRANCYNREPVRLERRSP